MLPSTETLINELPKPIKEAIKAALKYRGYERSNYFEQYYGHSCEDHALYFALKDLKEWLNKPNYGESILSKFFKLMELVDRFKINPDKLAKLGALQYDAPHLESKQIPKGKPSKRHFSTIDD